MCVEVLNCFLSELGAEYAVNPDRDRWFYCGRQLSDTNDGIMGESDPDAVDYYSRLGTSRNADIESIERQRKQADRRFSPMSTSPEGDEKRHMRINEASSVLEDPTERERYDACYDTFGRINGTAVYETLSTEVLDETFDDGTLRNHLEGFVEILGPVEGTRTFESYYYELNHPLSESIETDVLPNGYSIEDGGFGIAVWSRHEADQACELARWLTGGRNLWRTALKEPGAIDDLVADLPERQQVAEPAPTSADDQELFASEGGAPGNATSDQAPTTHIDGHPSSGAPDLPNEYTPADQREESVTSFDIAVGTPFQRLKQSLSYVRVTGAWGVGGTAAAAATGLLGPVVGGVVFLPLLAAVLLVISSAGGVNASVEAALGVPLASSDAPFTTSSVVHYLSLLAVMAGPAAVTVKLVVPWVHDRKELGLPRDSWLVFVIALVTLSLALFVGIGQRALPRSLGVGLTALVAVGTFQAAQDVSAPPLLSLLCRKVAAGAFGLVSAVAALVITDSVLDTTVPTVAATYRGLLTGLPLVEMPLTGIDNVELLVVGFGALAFVPLALTTLYSISYAVESIVLQLRSRAYS